MKKIRLSLRHFFQTQAEEESQPTPLEPTTGETTTGENESEPQTGEPASDETPAEETATAPPSDEVMAVEMSESDYQALLADASSWRKHKAELETLRRWHGELVKHQVTPSPDANAGPTGKKRSYEDAPWNR